MPDPDFVATAERSRDPWMLLDQLWGYLDEEDRDRIPSDLRIVIEEVLSG